MSNKSQQTVVITGANSGVGFEAAAQFAEDGWGRVILACRTEAKAAAAQERLIERTGRRVFDVLTINTAEVSSAEDAAAELGRRGATVDVLVLNAGASGAKPRFNSDGIELTWASTLVGHHVLTMRMLERGLLSPEARIIISGSEGARGNLAGMSVHEIPQIAQKHFGGDAVAATVALARIEHQRSFANLDEYVTAKRVVAWWAGSLSRRLPMGMTVNAVSPGSAPNTRFARDAGLGMKAMFAVMKLVGPLMGMAGPLKSAGRRYVDAAQLGTEQTGNFYATAHRKKLVGPMAVQTWPEAFTDRAAQDTGFDAVVALTGVAFPSSQHLRAAV